jgi:uroporphyrinogen-III synthase
MRILITRPLEDTESLAHEIVVRGHVPLVLPLLKIVPRAGIGIPNIPYQAICVTSANGIRSLSDFSAPFDVTVLAVGPSSKQAALDAGFKNVRAEGGDVFGLVNFIKSEIDPKAGPILYLSGAETSSDLASLLKTSGYEVDRLICYDAIAQQLSGQEGELKKANAVLLYSPRTARTWTNEISKLNLEPIAEKFIYFCLSANVAAALPQSWVKRIAKQPTESAMLDLLD